MPGLSARMPALLLIAQLRTSTGFRRWGRNRRNHNRASPQRTVPATAIYRLTGKLDPETGNLQALSAFNGTDLNSLIGAVGGDRGTASLPGQQVKPGREFALGGNARSSHALDQSERQLSAPPKSPARRCYRISNNLDRRSCISMQLDLTPFIALLRNPPTRFCHAATRMVRRFRDHRRSRQHR